MPSGAPRPAGRDTGWPAGPPHARVWPRRPRAGGLLAVLAAPENPVPQVPALATAAAQPRPAEPAPMAPRGQADGAAPITAPAPLRLALPRRPAASEPLSAALATQDPRVNSPRSASARFAETLGTDLGLQVKPLEGGGHRLQQGSRCVELRPAREAQLNPFDPSARNLPRQATGC